MFYVRSGPYTLTFSSTVQKLVLLTYLTPVNEAPGVVIDFTVYIFLIQSNLQTKNSYNWSCSFQETVTNVKLLLHDDGQKPIAMDCLSDSGYLKQKLVKIFNDIV